MNEFGSDATGPEPAVPDATGPDATVGSIGEFALIDRMSGNRAQGPHTLLGPGDDAAVVSAPDCRVVVTTDMLMQDRHFRLDWSAPEDIGRKAIAQNGADIAAMGARCTGFLVALACPPQTTLAVMDGLNAGLWAEARRAGSSIVGGDLVRGEVLVISITALGDLEGRAPVVRSGAAVGHVVAVRGLLGRSAAGLALLARDGASAQRRWLDLVAAHRVPSPDYAAGPLAARAGASAMTDVSDGLLADLGHVADASAVTIDLDPAALVPDTDLVDAGRYLGVDPLGWVLTGGEDHALAATFAPEAVPGGWRVVGTVVGRGADPVTVGGAAANRRPGWTSF